MQNIKTNNSRIAKNTLVLYFRMVFMALVNLYTSRIILNVLGVNDYGIYNVIGGFVAMFSIINSSLNAAIGRFITYELGTGNIEKLKKIFSSSVTIQLLLAVIILILVEIIGTWFINNKMVIDSDRIYAAHWILLFSAFTFSLNLINVPYNAEIIAHERMTAFAYISILESLLKLGVCFLIYISPVDKLIFYSFLIFATSLIIRLIYGFYCKKNFEECTFRFSIDKNLLYKMFTFSGWNFIGAGSGILRDQGVNVLLNIFCGPIVNASRGLAMQISYAISNFSNSIITAFNPQITKSYASNDKEYCFFLVIQGARYSSYLFLLVAVPILLETDWIMSIWLVKVPVYTVLFVKLTISYIFIEVLSYTMVNLMLATGDIRNYQLLVGGCQLLNFPFSYIALKCGAHPYWTFLIAIIIAIMCLILRLIMLRRMVTFPVMKFLKNVIFNVFFVVFGSICIPLLLTFLLDETFSKFIVVCIVSEINLCLSVYYIGFSKVERHTILKKITNVLRKI